MQNPYAVKAPKKRVPSDGAQNRYMANDQINYGNFAPDHSAEDAALKKKQDAEFWANLARAGGGIAGTAIGGTIGGFAGAGNPLAIGAGAGIGGSIGATAGNALGDSISSGADAELDRLRRKELEKQALMMALQNMRGI